MTAHNSGRSILTAERTPVPTRRWAVLTVMCLGYFLVLLDVTVVNVALPAIGTGLGAGVSGLQWVVDGYALPLAALLLAGGTIGDVRGHSGSCSPAWPSSAPRRRRARSRPPREDWSRPGSPRAWAPGQPSRRRR